MGYYIEVPENKNKAEQIIRLHGGEIIDQPGSFSEVPAGKALICVVDNGAFEAAGFAFDEDEFRVFSSPDWLDPRPKKWLLMDLAKARKLTGMTEHFGRE